MRTIPEPPVAPSRTEPGRGAPLSPPPPPPPVFAKPSVAASIDAPDGIPLPPVPPPPAPPTP